MIGVAFRLQIPAATPAIFVKRTDIALATEEPTLTALEAVAGA
jgi:hypothetical protein